ncbi:hypothetical protein [Lysinibacillus xylanilyticus]|uniref:hypothetical protein n=1 Tax=Lysinibacillus xylanilyticus TaxID=582475 RepID=UPI000AC79DF9
MIEVEAGRQQESAQSEQKSTPRYGDELEFLKGGIFMKQVIGNENLIVWRGIVSN